jgi:PPM family protein phosphatase
MQTNQDRQLFQFGFASDVGRRRRGEPNQDSLGIILPDPYQAWHPPLLLVADGLGGYTGGAAASQLVIRVFEQVFGKEQHPTNYPELLSRCAYEAHAEIRSYGIRDPALSEMGSTVTAVVLDEPYIHALNVGDSRAYVLRGNVLSQISQDQSWVAAQVRAGVLTPQEALHHPRRNRLEMAITAKRKEIKPYLSETIMEREDVILLCTDGLWSVVPASLICAAVSEFAPQAAADKLVAMANQSNSPDNVSVIVARREDADKGFSGENEKDTNP